MRQLQIFTFSLFSIALIVYVLGAASSFFVPLIMGLVITYLWIAIAEGIQKLHVPRVGSFLIACGLVGLGLWLFALIVGNNVATLVESAPIYQQKLNQLTTKFTTLFHLETLDISSLRDQVDFPSIVGNVALLMTDIAGFAGMITIYVIFLLVEYQFFDTKLDALIKNKESRTSARAILGRISSQVQTYVWLKTLFSLLTALCSYVILVIVGVDFAPFWALLIFLLNFIPTIGSIVATIFPCLLTLLQFGTWTPFLIVTPSLIAVQFIIGNVLEPRIVGKKFNLSGLVILLSLAIWGQIWGIIGMLLCVPIMMIFSIVLANFKHTRPIAILLSQNGNID